MRAILLGLALSSWAVAESTAANRAQAWLKLHGPSGDEAGMADLKNSDPTAFAMVQALLAKKQLGLLDPSHPSASFANAGEVPKAHKSFQEEAAEAGLTNDTPIPALPT